VPVDVSAGSSAVRVRILVTVDGESEEADVVVSDVVEEMEGVIETEGSVEEEVIGDDGSVEILGGDEVDVGSNIPPILEVMSPIPLVMSLKISPRPGRMVFCGAITGKKKKRVCVAQGIL
jgi:hypothetical protein